MSICIKLEWYVCTQGLTDAFISSFDLQSISLLKNRQLEFYRKILTHDFIALVKSYQLYNIIRKITKKKKYIKVIFFYF